MDLELVVHGSDAPVDELHSLREWLIAEGFGGQVDILEAPPRRGELGPLLEALRIAAEPAAAALVPVLVAWVRSRRGSVRLQVRKPDGEVVTLDATKVRGLTAEATARFTEDAVRAIENARHPAPTTPKAIDADR